MVFMQCIVFLSDDICNACIACYSLISDLCNTHSAALVINVFDASFGYDLSGYSLVFVTRLVDGLKMAVS